MCIRDRDTLTGSLGFNVPEGAIETPDTVNADTPEIRKTIPIHQRTAFGRLCIFTTRCNVTFLINIILGCAMFFQEWGRDTVCLLYTSPSPRDGLLSRMP